MRVATPNDPKLSDGGGWRGGCAGEGGGAAAVTAGAVRCSAWLGVADFFIESSNLESFRVLGRRETQSAALESRVAAAQG